MNSTNTLFENPVFVCGAPRSGTTLLMNLLDGHPNLMIFPHELHFLKYYRIRKNLPQDFFKSGFPDIIPQSLYSNPISLSQHNNYMFRTYGPGSEFNFGNHDFNKFRRIYGENLKDGKTLKDIISSWAKAFYFSNTPYWPDYEPIYFVDKRPLENEICSSDLLNGFPKAKFIHLVRHPKGRYASEKKRCLNNPLPVRTFQRIFSERNSFNKIFRLYDRTGWKYVVWHHTTDFAASLCAESLLSMKLALENQRKFGKDKYLLIRYEDLIQNRKPSMENIREFLGIKKSPFLYQQTQWRMPREAVSSYNDQKKSVSDIDPLARAEKNFKNITSSGEKYLVNFFLSDTAKKHGYDIPVANKKDVLRALKRPYKYERPRDYARKRKKTIDIIKNIESKALDVLWLEKWNRGEKI